MVGGRDKEGMEQLIPHSPPIRPQPPSAVNHSHRPEEMPVPLDLRDLSRFALLLDIDGTLLEIAPTPQAVYVPPTLCDTLVAIRHRLGGALALVSGRLIADIDTLFTPLRLPAVGGHGAEVRSHGKG